MIEFWKQIWEEYEWFFGLFGVSLLGIAYGLFKFVVWLVKLIKSRRSVKAAKGKKVSLEKKTPKRKTDWKKLIPTALLAVTCFFVITASVVIIKHFGGNQNETTVSNEPFEDISSQENEDISSGETIESEDELNSMENNDGTTSQKTDTKNQKTSRNQSATQSTKQAATASTTKSDPIIESGKCGSGITYTLHDSGALVLEGSGAMSSGQPWSSGKIKRVSFNGKITSIGNSAFSGCTNLSSISIPGSVNSVEECAFMNCRNLKSVSLSYAMTSIKYMSFSGCTSLSSVSIPGSVSVISHYAFKDCRNLQSVTIPKSVTRIYDSAFANCTSLTTVNYKGTEEEWNAISISAGNDCLTNATIHFS